MPWTVSDGGILDPAKMFPRSSRDRDGSSGGASTSSVDSITSGTTTSTSGKRDSTGSQSTAPSRKTSLKTVKSPEKESARQMARNFFSRKSSSTSRSSTPTLQLVDESELMGPLDRVNSHSSTTSSKATPTFSMKPGFLSGRKDSIGSTRDSSWIEDKINIRTSSKTAVTINTTVTAPLNEAELRQRILQAAKDTRCESPLSPTQAPPTPDTPVMRRPEMPPLPKMMPIIHRKPLGPRQNADWDLDPITPTVATIEEEDELLDGLSWIDTDTGSKRVSSNDTISEPLTIHSGENSAASSTAEIPLILDQSCLGPDGLPRMDGMNLVESVPILLDIKEPMKNLPSPPPSEFLLELEKMERSGLGTICEHLSEVPDQYQTSATFFEKRIWALIACQWLTFGKPLQSPAHDSLFYARHDEGRKVLHLHGPAADGWVLAAKYPSATFYSVSSEDVAHPNGKYSMPPNHHHLFTPAVSSPIPFPDNYFDVVVTRTLSSVLKSDELESVLRESLRILKPGGWLELHTIDPTLTRAGNITKHWIESRVLAPMENDFYSARPSDRIIHLMNELGYHKVKNARIALPAFATPNTGADSLATSAGSASDAQKVMVQLGRHFYEELYGQFLRAGHIGEGNPKWWWNSVAVRQECQRENTCFGLTISFGRKSTRT